MVGDLTGFLASIFMRGLPFIQAPTTLLAMVDAAIGGKTAINLSEGKNLLGTFHQPRLVAIDPEFLKTLPRAELLNGLAEVVKAALICDAGLLESLAIGTNRLLKAQAELTEIIYRAAAIKAEVVAQDEREGGLRRILNFGHTLGHGLEAASTLQAPPRPGGGLGHAGGPQPLGATGGFAPAEAQCGRRLIRELGLTRQPLPDLDPRQVMTALARDKKRLESGVPFVLLPRLGKAVVMEQVPMALVDEVLAEILSG